MINLGCFFLSDFCAIKLCILYIGDNTMGKSFINAMCKFGLRLIGLSVYMSSLCGFVGPNGCQADIMK